MSLFGTNGVRGIANEYLNPELTLNLARSLGTYMGSKGTVAIGCDTRISGQMLKSAAISGALSTGLNVIDVGIVPTPSIQYYVHDYADAGIILPRPIIQENIMESNLFQGMARSFPGMEKKISRKFITQGNMASYRGKKLVASEWIQ